MKDLKNFDEKTIKESIGHWLKNDNGHPKDNKRFFEIVANSFPKKLDQQLFVDVYVAIKGEENPDKTVDIYRRYEELYDFMLYLKEINYLSI